jgi:putative two-component system response regulator
LLLSPERVTSVEQELTDFAVQLADDARVRRQLRGRLRDLLAQLDRHEGCVPGHSASVCDLAVTVAREVGVAEDELAVIALGALMHDIGKVFIDGRVLAKPAPLSDGQWDMIRLHPALGEALLAPTLMDVSVLAVVRWHHERWDGAGYPDGLGGEATPLAARIVATADAYTAMREPRTYRPALDEDDALDELDQKCWTQFDGTCVRALLDSVTG